MNVTEGSLVRFNYQSHPFRFINSNGEPWFLAADVCKTLGFKSYDSAMRKLSDDEKRKAPRKLYGVEVQGADVWVINESGLYNLIFRSNKPDAKTFRRWVTNEVLPALRRTGTYTTPSKTTVPPPKPMGEQLELWPSPQMRVSPQLAAMYLDVAVSAPPRSRLARFLRDIKPLMFTDSMVQA